MDTIGSDAMAHRERHRERLPQPKRFSSVVEWNYPRAHRYWDDCGKLIAAVERTFPGLVCQGLREDGFHFDGLSRGIDKAVFYWDKSRISQGGRGDAGLAAAAGSFWPLVREGLSIASVNRWGHRTWLSYETDNVAAAARWLEGFNLLAFACEDAKSLGALHVNGSVIRTKLEAGGRRLRLETNAGGLSVDGKQSNGVIVDVDIVVEPVVDASDPAEFVSWNSTFIRQTIEPLFRRK